MRNLALTLLLLASAASLSAVEPDLPADVERARWTISDLTNWSLSFDRLPLSHAWSRPYGVQPCGRTYRLLGAGREGKCDGQSWSGPAKDLSDAADAFAAALSHWLTRSWKFR